MKLLPSALLAAALALLAGTSLAQTVELKPRWTVGKRYYQTMKMEQQSTITMNGQAMEQGFSNATDLTVTVSAHPDPAKRRLAQKYMRVVMDMNMAGQKMHFDTSDAGNAGDPLGVGKALGAFVGKELRLVVDENGKIVEYENLEEIMKPLASQNPMAAQMTKGMMSKESIAQSLDQSAFKALPGHPVKPGDSWPYTVNTSLPQIGTVSIKGTYTMKGMAQKGGANCAQVAEDGKMAMDLDMKLGQTEGTASPMAALGMKVQDSELHGTTYFDTTLGVAREAQFTQTMTMKMNNPADAGKEMSIPVKQSITVTLTKVEDVK